MTIQTTYHPEQEIDRLAGLLEDRHQDHQDGITAGRARLTEARRLAHALLDARRLAGGDVDGATFARHLSHATPEEWAQFAALSGLPGPTSAIQLLATQMIALGTLGTEQPEEEEAQPPRRPAPRVIPQAADRPICVRDAWLGDLDASSLALLECYQDNRWVPASTVAGTIEPWACWEIRQVHEATLTVVASSARCCRTCTSCGHPAHHHGDGGHPTSIGDPNGYTGRALVGATCCDTCDGYQ